MSRYAIDVHRDGAWRLLDTFHDREAALLALRSIAADFPDTPTRMRKLADDVPELQEAA